jgi:hypothetical protein
MDVFRASIGDDNFSVEGALGIFKNKLANILHDKLYRGGDLDLDSECLVIEHMMTFFGGLYSLHAKGLYLCLHFLFLSFVVNNLIFGVCNRYDQRHYGQAQAS